MIAWQVVLFLNEPSTINLVNASVQDIKKVGILHNKIPVLNAEHIFSYLVKHQE